MKLHNHIRITARLLAPYQRTNPMKCSTLCLCLEAAIICSTDVKALKKWEDVTDLPGFKFDDGWESPLYYTLPSVLEVWQSSSVQFMNQARAVMNLFKNRCFHFPETWTSKDESKTRKPFINIEGNANCIRDYIAKEISHAIHGELLVNPPPCLVPLKYFYGDPNNRMHGSYLSLSAYALSHAVKVAWGNVPVVATGYWNDITATSIADLFINESVPHGKSTIYEFPKDLLMPDITFFVDTMSNVPDSREDTRPPNWKDMFTGAFMNFKDIDLHRVIWHGADNVSYTILNTIDEKLGDEYELSIDYNQLS